MKKKCYILAVCSFMIALGIFFFSFILYHYTLADGTFTLIWQPEPGKPMITLLFAIWGVMFLFAGVMSFLIGLIFFSKKQDKKEIQIPKQK